MPEAEFRLSGDSGIRSYGEYKILRPGKDRPQAQFQREGEAVRLTCQSHARGAQPVAFKYIGVVGVAPVEKPADKPVTQAADQPLNDWVTNQCLTRPPALPEHAVVTLIEPFIHQRDHRRIVSAVPRHENDVRGRCMGDTGFESFSES